MSKTGRRFRLLPRIRTRDLREVEATKHHILLGLIVFYLYNGLQSPLICIYVPDLKIAARNGLQDSSGGKFENFIQL